MSEKANVIADFIWHLDDTNSVEEAFANFANVISFFGFDGVSYTLIPRIMGIPERIRPVFISSRDFSTGFLKHYQEANLAQHDFTIRRALEGCSAGLDWNKEAEKGLLAPQESEVISIAKHDYFIKNAITIPVELNEEVLAGFSFTCSQSRRGFDSLLGINKVLTKLCLHFHNFVYRKLENRSVFYTPVLASLTRNERCMVDLVYNGLYLKQSPDHYGISESSAGNTLKRLYEKFSVEDKGQLGYLIGRHQLIEMLNLEG